MMPMVSVAEDECVVPKLLLPSEFIPFLGRRRPSASIRIIRPGSSGGASLSPVASRKYHILRNGRLVRSGDSGPVCPRSPTLRMRVNSICRYRLTLLELALLASI